MSLGEVVDFGLQRGDLLQHVFERDVFRGSLCIIILKNPAVVAEHEGVGLEKQQQFHELELTNSAT